MKILVVSDKVVDWIYSPGLRLAIPDVELAISCGDLPAEYLDFIASTFNTPMFHVHGNHSISAAKPGHDQTDPGGLINLHGKVLRYKGFSFAGMEGSVRYNNGLYQYSQSEMWLYVIFLVPALVRNYYKYKKYLNVFVTHAPAWGVHDQTDLPHQGIKVFRWLVYRFQPDYHLHGHIHVYRPDTLTESVIGKTRVINTYGSKLIDLQ